MITTRNSAISPRQSLGSIAAWRGVGIHSVISTVLSIVYSDSFKDVKQSQKLLWGT